MTRELQPPGPYRLARGLCTVLMRHTPMQFLTRIAIRYGGIARIPLARGFLYLVSAPELVKALLVDHRTRFIKNTRYSVMQKVLGQGLLLIEGEVWRRQRSAAQPSFRPGALERQVAWMSPMIAAFLDGWDARQNDDATIELSTEFERLAQALAGRLLFGSVFAQHGAVIVGITESMRKFWPAVPRFLRPLTKKRRAENSERLAQTLAQLDAQILALIDESRASAEPCMLATLGADAADGCMPFTREELGDQMKTLFFAGYETTATSMIWTHYLLGRHPTVYSRVLEEVDRMPAGRTLTVEQLDALTYVEQVFKETLRLYSPIHSLSRVAQEECELGGYVLPKGATAMVSLYASHRLPQYWPHPRRFDPERFTAAQSAARHRFSYLPFAAGHRNCIGATLAMVEAKLIIAQIARRFRLHLVTRAPVRPHAGTTMHPSHAIRMRIESRGAPIV